MNLIESLNILCEKNIDSNNNWYNWKTINESKLPDGIILPNGNQFSKNIALKEKLNEAWQRDSDIEKKGELIKYYISTWGGIHRNKNDTMQIYMTESDVNLILKGRSGIASWSKALVIHNPDKYAIFDARVSTSLNCLQIIHNFEKKELFPILPSINKRIISSNKFLQNVSKKENWESVDESNFYLNYLNLLKKVAENQKTNISTVEMLLFAKAEDLIKQIF